MGKAKRKRMKQKKAKYDRNDKQEKDTVCTGCHQKGHKNRNIKDKIIKVPKDIRNILVYAQFFVNYYNFWYSISQLILGGTSTNKKSFPADIFSSCRSFSSRYKELVYKMDNPVAGYSQCLAAACFQVSACYNNMIVECFQSRLIQIPNMFKNLLITTTSVYL
ncbi:hypothetical protein AB4K20DRAFT_1976184 [Rhizopus microsporus]